MTVLDDPEVKSEYLENIKRAGSRAHLKGREKAALRTLMDRAVREGWDTKTLTDRVEDAVGLDARYTTAVENYRKSLLAQGMAPGKVRREAKAYAGRLRRHRAGLIARQEEAEALGDAQRKVWADRQVSRVYSRWAVRVFRTAKDERTCVVCRPMNGRRASLRHGSVYKGTTHHGPPLHVGCRCTEEIVDEGLVKTDPDLWGPDTAEIAEIEKRAQPRVRTPAGMRRYNLPLLAPIVAKPHLFPDLAPQVQDELDSMVRDGRPHIRAFGYGIRDVLERYPALNPYIGRIVDADSDRADRYDDVAWVDANPDDENTVRIAVSDKKMSAAFERFSQRLATPQGKEGEMRFGVPNRAVADQPDLERYGYAVAVHEMGHVAHKHFVAAQLRYAKPDRITRFEFSGLGLADQPVVSGYGEKNKAEQFAEWFTANLLGLGYVDDRFRPGFEAAMRKRAVWDEDMYVVSKGGGTEDFVGSVVEQFALGKGTRLGLVSKTRGVRNVATPEGSRHFKLPIGAPIIARPDRPRSDRQQARVARIATLVQHGKQSEALALLDRDRTLDDDDKSDIRRRIAGAKPASRQPRTAAQSAAGTKAPAPTKTPPPKQAPQKPAQQATGASAKGAAKVTMPTPVQERALHAYIGPGTSLGRFEENEFRGEGGGQFDSVNWDLRAGLDPTPQQDRMIRELTKLAQANRNHGGMTVQRGAAPFGIFALDGPEDLTGTVFRDKGFVSASKKGEVAEQAFDRRDTEGHVLFTYEIPDGHPALDVNALLGSAVNPREHEVILMPGQAFEITGDTGWQDREGKTPQRKITLRLTEAP